MSDIAGAMSKRDLIRAAEQVVAPRTSARPCVLHTYHRPEPPYTELHHVFPVGMGGPKNGEVQPCCPTGHRSVHVLIAEYVRHEGEPPWEVRRFYGQTERDMAEQAWLRFKGVA